jgi:hypothetical protein
LRTSTILASGRVWLSWFLLFLLQAPPVLSQETIRSAVPKQSTIQSGFQSMYNLDFQQAHRQFDSWQGLHPEDPMGPVSNAAAYLFSEFARLGVLESELFVDDDRFDARKKLSPDPRVKDQMQSALSQGDQLADRALASQPTDVNAQFAKVLAMGLRSNYAAMIEKRNLAAISYTKQGRAMAEQLLKQKPDEYDAYVAVGVENYLAGIKPAPIRWMLQMGGVQTDKATGIRELQQVADHGVLLAPFAQLLLAVAALRDKDNAKACSLLGGLASRYPRNPLYQNERAAAHCH